MSHWGREGGGEVSDVYFRQFLIFIFKPSRRVGIYRILNYITIDITVCPRSLDQLFIVTYNNIKWVKTSWTYSFWQNYKWIDSIYLYTGDRAELVLLDAPEVGGQSVLHEGVRVERDRATQTAQSKEVNNNNKEYSFSQVD